jgi:hypothetical protein
MGKYQHLKRLQSQVLDHLQDTRASHLEREVRVLNDKIPQRDMIPTYTCEEQRKALTDCYRKYMQNKSTENALVCRPQLLQFTQCADNNRRVCVVKKY